MTAEPPYCPHRWSSGVCLNCLAEQSGPGACVWCDERGVYEVSRGRWVCDAHLAELSEE